MKRSYDVSKSLMSISSLKYLVVANCMTYELADEFADLPNGIIDDIIYSRNDKIEITIKAFIRKIHFDSYQFPPIRDFSITSI